MGKIQHGLEVAMPAPELFQRLADPEKAPTWVPELLKVERTSAVQTGPGFEAAVLARIGGRDIAGTARMLECDPPNRLVLHVSLDVGVDATATVSLAPKNGRTRLGVAIDYSSTSKKLGWLASGFVGEALAQRGLRKAL